MPPETTSAHGGCLQTVNGKEDLYNDEPDGFMISCIMEITDFSIHRLICK